MNNADLNTGSLEPITLCLDGSQIEGVKELHAVRIANGWDVRFVTEPGAKKASKPPEEMPR
mgnify:CR=1 FL=1